MTWPALLALVLALSLRAAATIAGFLAGLWQHFAGPLVVIRDNGASNHGEALRQLMCASPDHHFSGRGGSHATGNACAVAAPGMVET
jgi:hypothetical protein